MLLTSITISDNVKLDFFHLEETSSSNANIFAVNKYKPVLNNFSRFLVTFDDNNVKASGVADVSLGYNFSVYREVKDTNQLMKVAYLDDGSLSVIDYNVVNNQTYKYYIFKEDSTSISAAVTSNEVLTCWQDWSLVDLTYNDDEDVYYADPNQIWKFNLNLSSDSQTQTFDSTVYNNFTQFPKVSVGKLNYATGGLTCLLGNIQKLNNGEISYFEPSNMIEEWNDFCSNGNIKLLKNRKGNAMLVMITGSSSQVDDVIKEQPNTITFSWVQVGDINGVTIIEQ